MAELDYVDQENGPERITGTGWLVGPYFAAKLPDHPLYFEGRLLAGMSHNRIRPLGTYTDRFETQRLLAQLKVAGQLNYGETVLKPGLSGSYTIDRQMTYTDSLGNVIPEQSVNLGQIELGLDFETPATIFGHPWQISGGVSGIYSSTSTPGAPGPVATSYDGARARIKLAASTRFRNGANLHIGASYDGIGAKGFDSLGLELGFDWLF